MCWSIGKNRIKNRSSLDFGMAIGSYFANRMYVGVIWCCCLCSLPSIDWIAWQSLCCVSKPMMKHRQKSDGESELPWFSYGYGEVTLLIICLWVLFGFIVVYAPQLLSIRIQDEACVALATLRWNIDRNWIENQSSLDVVKAIGSARWVESSILVNVSSRLCSLLSVEKLISFEGGFWHVTSLWGCQCNGNHAIWTLCVI